jgi:hypothetical protein
MDDQEFLAQRIKDLEDSVAYFSPHNKQEGERWVAAAFVENLRVEHTEDEFVSPDDDPPDVIFRDARFEIKEILDPGRRRHDEYKAELKRARTLTDPKDLLQMFRPKDETLCEIYRRCAESTLALERKYPLAVRSDTDLLFYVNLINVFKIIEIPYPDTSGLESSGWRSVSFVKGQRSCCFFARSDAPDFIKQTLGHVSHLHPR